MLLTDNFKQNLHILSMFYWVLFIFRKKQKKILHARFVNFCCQTNVSATAVIQTEYSDSIACCSLFLILKKKNEIELVVAGTWKTQLFWQLFVDVAINEVQITPKTYKLFPVTSVRCDVFIYGKSPQPLY